MQSDDKHTEIAPAPNGTPDATETETAEETETATAETEHTEEETFPRSYVENLRQENGKHRQRATGYAQRLHTELVRAAGRLADPTDLQFDEDHLDDPEKLTAAIDELLEHKPHLATRRPSGDIGMGIKGQKTAEFSLMDRLRLA